MAATLMVLFIVVAVALVAAYVFRDQLHRKRWYETVANFVARYPVTVALVILLGFLGYTSLEAQNDRNRIERQAVRACESENQLRAVLRNILIAFEETGKKSPTYSQNKRVFRVGIAALSPRRDCNRQNRG